ncbi:MAG: histidine phosphatase family protein [Rhodomicrobiaceae bacterium]
MSSLIDEKSGSISHSMPQLYLLRHGETDWNVKKRLQGRTDTSLNDAGRAQALRHGVQLKLELAQFFQSSSLKNIHLQNELKAWSFVSSPLKRCRETMEIVLSALELPSHSYDIDDRLLEISFGEWEGKSWVELRDETPKLVEARFKNPWDVSGPQGETYTELRSRVLSWYEDLSVNTIAVTHSGPSRIVRSAVSNLPEDQVLSLESPQDRFIKVYTDGFEWI